MIVYAFLHPFTGIAPHETNPVISRKEFSQDEVFLLSSNELSMSEPSETYDSRYVAFIRSKYEVETTMVKVEDFLYENVNNNFTYNDRAFMRDNIEKISKNTYTPLNGGYGEFLTYFGFQFKGSDEMVFILYSSDGFFNPKPICGDIFELFGVLNNVWLGGYDDCMTSDRFTQAVSDLKESL